MAPHGVRVDPDAQATTEHELRGRLGLREDPVVLCVSQKRPYKNQAALIRALADPRLDRVRVVLPGAATPYEQTLRELAQQLGVVDRVHLLQWVNQRDIEGLYRAADCFVLPSRLEGFGLPVLEAMARGLPVACSDASALPEVAGDAALLFDPDDPDDIACCIQQLLDPVGPAQNLVTKGRARAAQFTWAAAAEATVESYERALTTSARR